MSTAPVTIVPDPAQLHLLGLAATPSTITAVVRPTADQARCPQCGHASTHVHSRSVRRPADLPWHGVAMRLELHVRRFSCSNAACGQQIFAERLPGVVAPYAHRTERLDAWLGQNERS